MRAERVVEAAPAFHDDAGLSERVEDLAIEQLVPEAGVEALDVAILPRAPRLDVRGPCTYGGDPILDGLRNELRAIIGSYVLRHAPEDEEVGQDVDDVGRLELPVDPDRQTFPRELIDDVQHAILPSVMGAILHEVVGPDMVRSFCPKPVQAPSLGQIRLRFGCRGGTFRPSCRQIRSTRLSLTTQPDVLRRRAAIFR